MQKPKTRTTATKSKATSARSTRAKPRAASAAKTRRASSTKTTSPHLRRLHHLHFSLTAALALITLVGMVLSLGARTSASTTCTVSATLVNSCRPWLGDYSTGYTGGTNFAAQIANNESRIGRQLDIVHDYRTPGQVMSADDQTLAKRPNTILLMNWKPATTWSTASGSNATVNAQIDAMANSIKSLGSTKIMLTIFHEPENDVSPGGDPNCNITYKGNAGSVADYVNMWHNVRARFNAAGVTNVVWVMNYIGFSNWNCLIGDMWPGNNYVDWIMYDTYDYGSGNFVSTESTFYNFLSANSNSTHNYTSKPWGLAEWGEVSTNQSAAYSLYDSAKAALDNGSLPRLKAYIIWDSSVSGVSDQTQYTQGGVKDQTEQNHYNAFAQDPRFTNTFYETSTGGGTPKPPAPTPPGPDKTPPTVSLTGPANGSTVKGTINITGTASDNVGVTAVTLRIDDAYVATDSTASYSFSYNTGALKSGSHTIVLRAWDAANNMGQSGTVTVKVAASSSTSTGSTTTTPTSTSGTPAQTVIVFGGSPTANTLPVKGTLEVVPSVAGSTVAVQVDNKPVSGASVNTSQLTNGTHTVTVTQNGQTTTQTITVDNPWPTAAVNNVKAHPVAYTSGGAASMVLLVLVGWFARKYTIEMLDAARVRKLARFGPGGTVRR